MDRVPESSRVEAVDLGSIPGLPGIYRDYILHFERVRGLYKRDYRDPERIVAASSDCRSGLADSGELKRILREQCADYDGGKAVEKNIDTLCEGGCAVVTGQQIGLFCGPAYTLYKAATALRLAEVLNSVGRGKHVPVFWMECEDHDNMEVGRVHVLDRAHQVSTSTLFGEPSRKPTGQYLVDDGVEGLIAGLETTLAGSKYVNATLATLRRCYEPCQPMSVAFARLLSETFKGRGLIIVDPSDPGIKRLASSIYAQAVVKWKDVNEAISRSSERLAGMGYSPQIETGNDRAPFFIIRNGERLPVFYEGGGFTDLSGEKMTLPELQSLAEHQPETFSPNVSLRPLVQDHLFHTSVYVGGPSEIAYFAQVEPLYEIFGLDMPAIFPRAQFTMVEPVVARALEKLGARVGDFAQNEKDLVEGFLKKMGALSGVRVLDRTRAKLNALVDELAASLGNLEPEMAGPLETYRKKTAYQLERLEEKLKATSARRHDTLQRQVQTVRNHLFPLGKPQERVLNTCYHLAQFGEEFARAILSCVEPFEFHHRAVWMRSDPPEPTSRRSE